MDQILGGTAPLLDETIEKKTARMEQILKNTMIVLYVKDKSNAMIVAPDYDSVKRPWIYVKCI